MDSSGSRIGRYCELHDLKEVTDLVLGMDFRLPQYRREVFLRFYEFHLKYRSHPGCVYYLMPYLATRHQWSREEKLWFAFINGNTQNPVTSWLIFRQFPSIKSLDTFKLKAWFDQEWPRLAFDTDRRHHKRVFPEAVRLYQQLTQDGQGAYFDRCYVEREEDNFHLLWRAQKEFYSFGRLSMFSYLEYLRIMGEPIQCNQLFLTDLDGSKSHRNGLCKVLGRDDLDWHDSNPEFPGYSGETLAWLIGEAETLRQEAVYRMIDRPYAKDVGYFTLESALCTFKGWFRPNRRYPNVYNDMLAIRIWKAEKAWGEEFADFWDARGLALPDHLRVERSPSDPGLVPAKQNHFRETGEVIMMDRDWPCFANHWNHGRLVKCP